MNSLHIGCEELLAFALDNTVPSHVDSLHIDECPLCQRDMSSYQKITASLLPRLYRSQCPSGTALSLYCLPDGLSELERCAISRHVAICPLCAGEVEETRQFLETESGI